MKKLVTILFIVMVVLSLNQFTVAFAHDSCTSDIDVSESDHSDDIVTSDPASRDEVYGSTCPNCGRFAKTICLNILKFEYGWTHTVSGMTCNAYYYSGVCADVCEMCHTMSMINYGHMCKITHTKCGDSSVKCETYGE